jgi:hypothetical protein
MINLTTNFNITLPISRATKWKVDRVDDQEDLTPPQLLVKVRFYDGNTEWPTNPYVLYIRDTTPSQILTVNASPMGLRDAFQIDESTLSGTAYTTLAAAYWAASGKSNMKKAVENLLVSSGALPSQLAGT